MEINNSFNGNKNSFNKMKEDSTNKYWWKLVIPILVFVIGSLLVWYLTK